MKSDEQQISYYEKGKFIPDIAFLVLCSIANIYPYRGRAPT